MKKIDGHLHLVRDIAGFNGNGRLNALGNGDAIWDTGEVIHLVPNGYGDDSFTAENVIKFMDAEGIEKAMVLQGSLNGFQNYYTWQSIKQYPDRFMGAFSVDIFTDNYMKIVQRHVEILGFRALKLEISEGGGMHGYHGTTPFRLDSDPRVAKILHYLSDFPGFTVIVDYGNYDQISYQPEVMATLAKTYPSMQFVAAHLSFPHVAHIERLKVALNQWAGLDNLYTDISAIQDIDDDTVYPFEKSQKVVRIAKEILGSEHLIWGSDSPWSSTFNSYHNLSTWLEQTDIFTDQELENVLYNNANRIYFNDEAVEAIKSAVDPAYS
ncbi:amidohydrolase [Weissella minor]|uniref:amidohydrolase family protein n=1 Tax=Weissella minor TaxID=1620 RepID=UPI001BB03DB7|nr:amidohydrolase family protein [Weissella minor]MBS0949573.1 amidohydrolase [Weissella minor]